MRKTSWLLTLAVAGLASLAGCKTWATAGEHTITIEAPEKVNRGEKLTFTVVVKDAAGVVLRSVAYEWSVDWVDLPGIQHKGKSGAQEKINVKGAPGKATLHILGYDAQGNLSEIAKREFQVE